MKKRIVVTDLTRMSGTRVCIAGYLDDGTCVRPVFNRGGLEEAWLFRGHSLITRPFARVEFDFQYRPSLVEHPHTEDWIIDRDYRVGCGSLGEARQKVVLPRTCSASVNDIFGANIHHESGYFVLNGEGEHSLGTVKPDSISQVSHYYGYGRWNYQLSFTDAAGESYNLSVVDLAFRMYLDHLRDEKGIEPSKAASHLTALLQRGEIYLRIGLSRGWEKHPDRCYLQITGVYSYPDYLDGRCFADFYQALEERDDSGEEPMPF